MPVTVRKRSVKSCRRSTREEEPCTSGVLVDNAYVVGAIRVSANSVTLRENPFRTRRCHDGPAFDRDCGGWFEARVIGDGHQVTVTVEQQGAVLGVRGGVERTDSECDQDVFHGLLLNERLWFRTIRTPTSGPGVGQTSLIYG